jgi:hypothetical protein
VIINSVGGRGGGAERSRAVLGGHGVVLSGCEAVPWFDERSESSRWKRTIRRSAGERPANPGTPNGRPAVVTSRSMRTERDTTEDDE